MTSARRRRTGILALSAIALACCQTADPKLYTLSATPPEQTATGAPLIAIGRIALPKYLDRAQMIRYGGANLISSQEFDRWAEPFGDMLSRVLVEDLALRLPASQVFQEHSFIEVRDAVLVDLEITEFAVGPTGEVELYARWMIRRPHAKDQIGPARRFAVRPASGSAADAAVAMSSALGLLSNAIAASLG